MMEELLAPKSSALATISSLLPTFFPFFAAGPPEGLKLPNNPGTIEELHKRCQGVFPMCFEGGTLRVNKGLNSHFQVSHTLNLPTNPQSPSGYKFGATYVGTKMLSPTEVITELSKNLSKKFSISSYRQKGEPSPRLSEKGT